MMVVEPATASTARFVFAHTRHQPRAGGSVSAAAAAVAATGFKF